MAAVNVLNGLKQDNTVDLQLGHFIMIVTNPRWQMTALLALWINRSKARVHYRECVVQLVDRCGKKNQSSSSFYFSLSLLVNIPLLSGFLGAETVNLHFDARPVAGEVERLTTPGRQRRYISVSSHPGLMELIQTKRTSPCCCAYYLANLWLAGVKLRDVLM